MMNNDDNIGIGIRGGHLCLAQDSDSFNGPGFRCKGCIGDSGDDFCDVVIDLVCDAPSLSISTSHVDGKCMMTTPRSFADNVQNGEHAVAATEELLANPITGPDAA